MEMIAANNNVDKIKLMGMNNVFVDGSVPTYTYINSSKLYDIEQLIALCKGDCESLRSMLDVFVKVSEEAILQINEALRLNSAERIKRISHKIKPMLYSLNVSSLYADVIVLESIEDNDALTVYETQRIDKIVNTIKMIISEIKNTFLMQ